MFPATYTIRPGEKASALVADQLAAFSANVAKVDMSYAQSKNLTPYDVLTIASMIEREARAPGDRAKVAAVIYNRLHRGMNLGIDATILYHLGSWSATIHQSDIDSHEPYNTRANPGPSADADLQPRPRLDPGRRAPGRRQLPLLRRRPRAGCAVLHGELRRLQGAWRLSRGARR